LVVFLLQGEAKRAILDRLLSGDGTLPARRLRPVGDVFWFVDRAAAAPDTRLANTRTTSQNT
jgi:6-phosphogluconolactonase